MHPHDRDREALFRRNTVRWDFGSAPGPCLAAPKPDREHREAEHRDDREDRERDPGGMRVASLANEPASRAAPHPKKERAEGS